MIVLQFLSWYLVIGLVGWVAFPLAYRLLASLPDRGLAFARPLGLLLAAYLYWILAALKVLQNDTGGVVFALLLVTGLSAWALWRSRGDRQAMLAWLNDHRRLVFTTELLFLLAFAAWTVVRAANPDASGTEKPMELAFINAILRSPAFPPSDPWLSGYSISYYYFGYVMVAMLARLTGVAGGVAFNLGLASWFALTALAAYGLLYNLLALRGVRVLANKFATDLRARRWALLAPLFVLLVSNLEGLLEMLHARGLFWSGLGSAEPQSGFWSWLNIQELTEPPALPLGWVPERVTGIWWWRASRVLQDFDINGGSREIIDEFPAFSYLLGDLHPHVLAMPFALLATALALNVFLRARARGAAEAWAATGFPRPPFWLAALVFGGLAFLNTWDFPIYVALFAAAVVLGRFLRDGFKWNLLGDFLLTGISLGVAGILLYIPFYLGFASQASGLLPSLVFFTRGVHFWIMFGSLLLPVLAWLVWTWRRQGRLVHFLQGSLFAGLVIAGLWLLSSLYGALLLGRDPGLSGIYGANPDAPLILTALLRRFESPGMWLSLFFLLALVWGLLQSYRDRDLSRNNGSGTDMTLSPGAPDDIEEAPSPGIAGAWHSGEPFVLLMILLGSGLVLFPEFFYLRDQFGWRMNTIFKFYFQAWILWAVAAAYAASVIWNAVRRPVPAVAYRVGLTALVAAALVYPFFGVLTHTNQFSPARWTLNGSDYLDRYNPEEMEAIRWLQDAPYGVVAEAVGGSYSGYARAATHSGLPNVLGWPGHESQWRGGASEMGSREPDLERLFRARDWEEARAILEKYEIRYVFIGSLERGAYRAEDDLFQRHLKPVFRNASVAVYEYAPDPTLPQQVAQP